MVNTHRSVSYLWEQTMRKLFPRRTSLPTSRSADHVVSQVSAQGDEHKDGFYMYSQTLIDQENQRLEELRLRSSNSTGVSYASALMDPVERPPLPYAIGTPDWNTLSESLRYLDEIHDESVAEWVNSVLSVFSKVYAISKFVVMMFLHYGVELEDDPDTILFHLQRSEQVVMSESITDLIASVEGLYHALYARLIMEIANADLCASFNLDVRRLATKESFILPEPSHLYKILLVCKGILDDSMVCYSLNRELIRQHQAEFIRRSVDKAIGVGFILDDLIGYRRYALGIISEKSSAFCKKWGSPSTLYQMPPGEILATQSEKYLAFLPRTAARLAAPALDLPFIDPHSIHPDSRERNITMDQRKATLAKLEGKCIGDLRLEDDRLRLMDLVRERKCICRSVCNCAWECTLDVERRCPCAEPKLTIMVAKCRRSVGPLPFGPRCTSLAKALFQGAASIKPDANGVEITAEMNRAMLIFAEEIQKQRTAATLSKRPNYENK